MGEAKNSFICLIKLPYIEITGVERGEKRKPG